MPTPKELQAELDRLKAENAKLKKANDRPISFKVSEKGAASVYGLGRFPVTLYKEQWAKLFDNLDGLKEFLEDNQSRLKSKGDD